MNTRWILRTVGVGAAWLVGMAAGAEAPKAAGAASPNPESATVQWSTYRFYDFEDRARALAGLGMIETRVDGQINELTAHGAAVAGRVDMREWDSAMKDLRDARTHLKAMGRELREADKDTWDQAKDRVEEAWHWTQDAYSKVKDSVTQ